MRIDPCVSYFIMLAGQNICQFNQAILSSKSPVARTLEIGQTMIPVSEDPVCAINERIRQTILRKERSTST
jgi:hypothetical protein